MKPPKIERGILRTFIAKERPLNLPLDEMEVGDSILVPTDYYEKYKARIYVYAVDRKQRLSARRVENGHRIWRIK